MINIDAFGVSMIFDRATSYVLLTVKTNELAHFINSALLDTATHLLPHAHLAKLGVLKPGTELILRPDSIERSLSLPPQDVVEKRARAKLLQRGYWFLLEQATLIETSFDGFDFLSSSDLPLYLHDKSSYVQALAESTDLTAIEAEKHLDFLANNLVALHARKKQLIQKYAVPLRAVETEQQYSAWYRELYNEVIGLGQV